MRSLFGADGYLAGLGMASLVLGVLATGLSVLPVLGVPLSLFGLGFGILGLIGALFSLGPSLRASLGGIAASVAALALGVAIAYAPAGFHLPEPQARDRYNQAPDRPSTPPPAANRWFE